MARRLAVIFVPCGDGVAVGLEVPVGVAVGVGDGV
jgi:hypothetical protein